MDIRQLDQIFLTDPAYRERNLSTTAKEVIAVFHNFALALDPFFAAKSWKRTFKNVEIFSLPGTITRITERKEYRGLFILCRDRKTQLVFHRCFKDRVTPSEQKILTATENRTLEELSAYASTLDREMSLPTADGSYVTSLTEYRSEVMDPKNDLLLKVVFNRDHVQRKYTKK